MARHIESEEENVSFKDGFRGIRRLLQPYRNLIAAISFFGVIVAIADAFIPYITGRFFDALIALSKGAHMEWHSLPLWAALLLAWVGIRLFSDGFEWWIDRKRRWLVTSQQPGTHALGFAHLLQLPISYHVDTHVHEQIEKINSAAWRVNHVIYQIAQIFPQLLSIMVGIILAYTIKPELAHILVIGVVVYGLIMAFMLRGTAKKNVIAHRAWSEAWDDSVAMVSQVHAVKQATAEAYELKKLRTTWEQKVTNLWYHNNELIWNNINFFQRLTVFLTQLAIFVLSVQFVANGTLTVGQLVALNGYALMFFGPLILLGSSWQNMQNSLNSAGRLNAVLEVPTENYHPKNAKTCGELKGEVVFDDVSFKYEKGQEVLSHLSFTANPGQSIAFVGESGVGKSTAISLISGYYFPTEGRVLVDGVDTREWDLLALRSRIAVVPQEVALFNDTIRANIRYGSFDAPDSAVERAAQEAHIHDFVLKQPKQYDTLVGERGIKLSVGQKQRVAIARAILRNPEFLILDEPTSALDIETEQIVSASFEKLMKGRTTFIIAHRLSTVRKADQILVIKDGQVAEQGSHAELIAKEDGIYKHLYELHVGLHE